IDPSNPNRWLIGAVGGGIWETTNAGNTWTARSDASPSLAMGAIAFSPTSPNIVFAGTGESSFSGDSEAGGGLLRSMDGGSTWSTVTTAGFTSNAFSAIRPQPSSSNVLAAATRAEMGRGPSDTFPPNRTPSGVYMSIDGGNSFVRTLNGEATDLAVNPGVPSQVYAAIGDPFSSAALNGLFRSVNAGQTWAPIAGPWPAARVGRIALAIAPTLPSRMFVAIQDAFGGGGPSGGGGLLGLFRTDNAFDPTPTFTQITTEPAFCGSQCWYDLTLAVDPT